MKMAGLRVLHLTVYHGIFHSRQILDLQLVCFRFCQKELERLEIYSYNCGTTT